MNVLGGGTVSMSDATATVATTILEMLVGLLERGEIPPPLRRGPVRRSPTVDELLARMFPDADLRRTHGAAMRADVLAATRRLLAARQVGRHLNQQDVDDWIMVTGVAQFLFVPRKRGAWPTRQRALQHWLNVVQYRLVVAANPELAAEVSAWWDAQ
ncbi:MAG TPA: hypothetical protein VGL80_26325 [Pseudonocardiaceae bacterium]